MGKKKINSKVSNKIAYDYLIVFVLCSMTRIIMSFGAEPFYAISDEVSAASVAARLSGFDWSATVSQAGYYGFGYLWIFAPLFKMGISAFTIYKIICAFSGVLIGLTGVIAYKIIRKFIPAIERIYAVVIAIMCGFLSVMNTYALVERNEEILTLMSWVVAYLLFDIIVNGRTWNNQSLLLLALNYVLFLHTRAIVLVLALMALYIFYLVVKKRNLLNLWFWGVELVLWYVSKLLISLYQSGIWNSSESVKNASVEDSVLGALQKIHYDWDQLKAMFMIFFGQIYSATEMTKGLFLIAIIALVYAIWIWLRKKEILKTEEGLIWVGLFFLMCILATIACQSLTWSSGVYDGITSGNYNWVYKYKAFTYMRYPGPFMPPFFLCGTLLFLRRKEGQKSILFCMLGIGGILSFFWYKIMLPYMEKAQIDIFIILSAQDTTLPSYRKYWIISIILLIVLLFAWLVFYFTKIKYKYVIPFISIAVLSGILQLNVQFNMGKTGIVNANARVDAGNEFLSVLKEKIGLSANIYVLDVDRRTDHQNWYFYQYVNYDMHIVPGLPKSTKEDAIMLTSGIVNSIFTADYYVAALDNNEYVYYRGDENVALVNEVLNELGLEPGLWMESIVSPSVEEISGSFELVSEKVDSSEYSTDKIMFLPGNKDTLKGKQSFSMKKFMNYSTQGELLGYSIVGTYVPAYINQGNDVILQFEAYTKSGSNSLIYNCGDKMGEIILSEKPTSYYIYLTGNGYVGDLFFATDLNADIVIKNVYVVDYGKNYSVSDLFVGDYEE